jgi:hypothetical protein
VGLNLLQGERRTPARGEWTSETGPDPSEWGPDYSPSDPGVSGQRIPGPCSGRGPGTTCVQT